METGAMLIGHANKALQKFRQIGTSAGHVTANFYGFTPVNGDVTVTTLLDKGSHDASAYADNGIYYQDKFYPGQFIAIQIASGFAILYYGEQD
jgi:hypothetical protein